MKRVFLLLLTVFLVYQIGSAQAVLSRQKAYGGIQVGGGTYNSMALTSDGGLIVGGMLVSPTPDHTPWYYGMAKIDKAGKLEWRRLFDTTRQNGYYQVQVLQLKDGNYAYCVLVSDTLHILKLTPEGTVIWNHPVYATEGGKLVRFGGVTCLRQTKDNGFIMAADDFTLSTSIVKLDSSANVTWYTFFRDSFPVKAPYINSVVQTDEGTYLAAGTFSYNEDYYVVSLDATGKKGFDTAYHANGSDNCYTIENTSDGGYVLGGVSNSKKSGVKTQDRRGDNDYWILKLNHALGIQWDCTLGGGRQEAFSSIAQTGDGGYIVTGLSPSPVSGDKTEDTRGASYWQNDYWTVKLTKDGIKQWDKTTGGAGDDQAVYAKEYSRGRYIVAGESYSYLSGDKTSDPAGDHDLWVVLLTDTVSTAAGGRVAVPSIVANHTGLSVYPNPAKSLLHVQAAGTPVISLLNSSGTVVLTQKGTGQNRIDVSRLPAGIYYIKTGDGEVRKVVVEK